MTLLHRLTTGYAIVTTSLLFGYFRGHRHLATLAARDPDLQLTHAQSVGVISRISVPFVTAGIIVGFLVLLLTRPRTRKRNTEAEQDASSLPSRSRAGS